MSKSVPGAPVANGIANTSIKDWKQTENSITTGKMKSSSKHVSVKEDVKRVRQLYMVVMFNSIRIQSKHQNTSRKKSWKPESVLIIKNNMNNAFSEDDIPHDLRESLYRIHSLKVRKHFLALLEKFWNRTHN
jgi:hypothetical protein